MSIRDFSKIYGALVLFHLAVLYRGEGGAMLWLSKPLIVGALLVFVISKLKEVSGLKPIIWALLFSWLGDIALMYDYNWSFLAGMGAFALAQIAYITWYARNWKGLHLSSLMLSLVISIGALYLLLSLVSLPEDLRVPVYGYFGLISIHLTLSLQTWSRAGINVFPALGIFLFVFSDWWIAWAKFGGGLNADSHNSLIIMLSYASAQGLIALGIYHRLITPDPRRI